MTAITITGALTMTSLNGDGPQLLTEAAEFLSALAQMGVQMAVEINLRPVGAEKPEPAQPDVAPIRSLVTRRGSADDITLYEGHPSLAPAPVDPTPAAPAQPEKPHNLTPWKKLDRAQRTALLNMEGRLLAKALGQAPTMQEWDIHRPAEYPSASGVSKHMGMNWIPLSHGWAHESK